ncbi:MAG TPA: hypothetical protein VLT15_00905 [Acidimicrobiia bacterium]|nr:hypothetical protein [Acidimicrobiia bacterium]
MSVFWLRVIIAALLLAVVAVAAVPLLVLLDLGSGGTGYGVCGDGLSSCATDFGSGPALAVGLALVLFGLVATLRVMMRIVRRMERRKEIAEATRRLSAKG